MDTLELQLSPREEIGKKVKKLRRNGVTPVHLFGRGTQSTALQVETRVLRRILPRAGTNVPISVAVDGQNDKNICFVREVQRHPVTDDVLHVDFMRVDVSQRVTAEVPIILEGQSPAVEDQSGTLLQILNTVRVESLPMNMPGAFHVDISALDDFEKAIRVGALQTDEDVTILMGPEEIISTVVPPRIEEEVAEEVLEEAGEVEAAAGEPGAATEEAGEES